MTRKSTKPNSLQSKPETAAMLARLRENGATMSEAERAALIEKLAAAIDPAELAELLMGEIAEGAPHRGPCAADTAEKDDSADDSGCDPTR